MDGEITDKQFAVNVLRTARSGILENVKVVRHNELSGMYPEAVANIVHVDLVDGKRLTKARGLSNGTREKSAEGFGGRREVLCAR